MSPAFMVGILGASLLSSLHCAGMCGPFVAFYSAGATGKTAHFVYHAERGVMYSLLGALAGAFGSGLDLLGERAGTLRLAALVASLLTIVWGILAFLPRASLGRLFPSLLSNRLVTLRTKSAITKASILGLSSPLLPCGTLYAFVTLAAGSGGALEGALTLFIFFLGTLPGLVGLGTLSAQLARWFGVRLPRALGAALVVIGLFGVYERGRGLLTSSIKESSGPSCHGHE